MRTNIFPMTALYTALFCLACILAAPGPALAETVVIGTRNPVQDTANVQKAVDGGGSVLLKGDFDFGEKGRVLIRKSVEIRGEVDSLGLPVTIIRGGFWNFYSPLPVPGAPPAKKGPIISVSSLHFQGPKGTPLHFPYAAGLTIRNNIVENVEPQELKVEWTESDSLLFAAGVVAGTRLDYRKTPLERAVSGVITIKDNRFHMMVNKPGMTAGRGVMVDWTWGALIRVENNIITKASRNGIELLDNVRSDKGEGSILVAGNKIVTDDRGIEYPNKFTANGIVAGWYFDTAGGSDFARNSKALILRNRVEIRGETSTGVFCYGNDATVAGNDIIVSGGDKSRGIIQTGSRGFFTANRFRGKGQYAIFNVPFEKLTASTNIFAWNDFKEFTGLKGQMLLSGDLNRVLGRVMVKDKGRGNTQEDVPPVGLPGSEFEGDDWEPVESLP
ncbi:right-handed parallel beta-helix repeat-containing protein [Salidesulfovibrio onnuriiensis]|uniref:right-handed parallel beta-helix repeat-containing protein n=1 Tax=Salidesulfovibrio onnuriiensis TaxID=2583823 RepID=UPI0011C7D402|nr:right-handed parallel beta-helix repeat-containing protein [Salidesulfovibrio onnuriiensis]